MNSRIRWIVINPVDRAIQDHPTRPPRTGQLNSFEELV